MQPQSESAFRRTFSALSATQAIEYCATLSDADFISLHYDWALRARPEQQTPTVPFRGWLVNAGRGFGKTRAGAEQVRKWQEQGVMRMIIAGATARDCRQIMIEGDSGLLAISPPDNKPKYEPSKAQLTWPNGAIANIISAEDPESFRGQQAEKAWCDELAKWRYADEAWKHLQLGLRLGDEPQWIVTTTPRPTVLIKRLLADDRGRIVVTSGSTYDNADNLPQSFIEDEIEPLVGTTLGRQEVFAEMVDDFPSKIYSSWHRGYVVDELPDEFDEIIAASDWGSSNPTSFAMIGFKGDTAFVFGEYYKAKVESREKYEHIAKAHKLFRFGALYMDPAAGDAKIDLQSMRVPVINADNNVLDGIKYVQKLIEQGRLRVHTSCHNLLDELDLYSWTEDRRGHIIEKPVKYNDHAVDMLRYGLYSRGEWRRSHGPSVAKMTQRRQVAG